MLPDTDCADDAADDHADDDGDDDDDAPRMLPFRLVRVTLALMYLTYIIYIYIILNI